MGYTSRRVDESIEQKSTRDRIRERSRYSK